MIASDRDPLIGVVAPEVRKLEADVYKLHNNGKNGVPRGFSAAADITDILTNYEITGLQARAIAIYLAHPRVSVVSRILGIGYPTWNRWKTEPNFAAALEDASAVLTEELVGKAYEMALNGDSAMIRFLLSAHNPSVYNAKRAGEEQGKVFTREIVGLEIRDDDDRRLLEQYPRREGGHAVPAED